jgi:hypothetical protein
MNPLSKPAISTFPILEAEVVLLLYICNLNSRLNVVILKRYLKAGNRLKLARLLLITDRPIPSILITSENPTINVCKSQSLGYF